MKKKLVLAAVTALFTLSMGMTAAAGQWQSNTAGWWWQNDDGTWPVNSWQWIDGNSDGIAECYYFNAEGYMLANTVTPDGYTVNSDGAWIVDGMVQTQAADDSGASQGNSSSAAQTNASETKTDYLAYGFTDAAYDMLHSDRAANAAKYGVVREEPRGTNMYVIYANDIIGVYENNSSGKPSAVADNYMRHSGDVSPVFAYFDGASQAASITVALPETANNPEISQISEVWWFLYYLSDLYDIPVEATQITDVSSNWGYLFCGDDIYLYIKYYPEKSEWLLMVYPQ